MPDPRQPISCATSESQVHEHWADVDGHRVRFLHGGTGPPLLLVHGLLGYAFSWRLNLPVLAKEATVYAPDLVGTGLSERVPGLDCSMQATAGRLLRFMDAQGIEACDLLGTSHGGAIAIMLAALAIERGESRIKRLILVAPANPWAHPRPVLMKVLRTPLGAALFRLLAPRGRFTHGHFLRRMYGDPRRVPPGTVAGYSLPLATPAPFDYGLAVVRCWEEDMQRVQAALPRIANLPTLLIWGSEDPVVSPASADHLHRQLSNSRLVVLHGAGHLPYEEVPEAFNRIVLEFLERRPS